MKKKLVTKALTQIMRLFCLLLVVGCLHVNAKSLSQTVTMRISGEPLKDVLANLQHYTGYSIVYKRDLLKDANPVTINSDGLPLKNFLDQIFDEQPLKYTIEGKTILVVAASKNKLGKQARPAVRLQQKIVSGKVVDYDGNPMTGVTVTIKGKGSSANTNSEGEYSIVSESNEDILIFTMVGFRREEIMVGDRSTIHLTMRLEQSDIDEVVVVGFGTQKKSSVVGAITTIAPSSLQANQTRSITNSLAGQASGIIAVQRSGEPGYDNSDFWIRGMNTFGAGTNPLILIDGVERSLDNISPEEIESFSILKDASATAVYGVRGGNGVILVQTKKGKAGKPRLTFRTDAGFSTPTVLPEFVGAAKYMQIVNEAFQLSGVNPIYNEDLIFNTENKVDADLYPDVNWLDEVTVNRVPSQRMSFDVNGGTDLLRYSLITAVHNERGVIVSDPSVNYDSQLKLSKYNVRSNVDLNITPSTLLNVGIGGYIVNRNAPGVDVSSILSRAFNTPPNYHPPVYSNGQIAQVGARYNPWADATQTGFQKQYSSNIESLVSLKQDIGAVYAPLKGLTIDALFSFDAYNWNNINRTKTPRTFLAYGRDADGVLLTNMTTQGQEFLGYSKDAGGTRSMYLESKLNYETSISEHSINALGMVYFRDHANLSAGDAITSLPYRSHGVAGRFAYNYAERYFAEFNFGYNGSENFAEGFRFGFFPSIAAGWIISNEEFMAEAGSVITNLKLRGSYGLVGNDKLQSRRFAYISTVVSKPGYSFGYAGEYGLGGWTIGDFGVPNLTWETAKKANLGLDFDIKNSLSVNLDFFHERRQDIFMQRKIIPETAGFDKMPYANFGVVQNRGVELNVVYNKMFSPDLHASIRGSYTYAKNKVLEYDEPESLKQTSRSRTNQPLNQYFGLTAIGLFEEDDFLDPEAGILKQSIPTPGFGIVKPGDIRYADLNGDGVVDAYDESPIGRPSIPEIVYGFGFSVRYKRVDVGTFFQGSGNFTNMLSGGTLIPGSGAGGTGNIYANVDDRWTPENPSQHVFWPRLSNTTSENNMKASTWWIKNAGFLRMKNLEVGYSINSEKIKAVKNLRLFFRGSNLLTFSGFDMWDPEIGSSDGLRYPLQKIYALGVDLSF